ncbi:hypothetical protein ABZX85_32510 [Streptomyces sp. NPDC004539]|uniref:hypothetical protein n=1 Tax=Streptomyces sp. NPDC004539 TaxID=3154280 RepID=UPI0033BC57AA
MNVVARWARAEWGPLWLAVRRGWAVPVMTVSAVCTTSVLQAVQNLDWGYQAVQDLGAVRAQDPLPLALLRTPLSLFVPALDLPVWGALAQILLVFGLAEICLGWWRTLTIAYLATLAGTLYARTGIALGPDVPVLGLPASDAKIVDTGPSAAVVGLAVFLAWRYRAYVTGGVVVLAMLVEVAVKPNLAGKEHVAAILAVAGVVGVLEWWGRRSGGRARGHGRAEWDEAGVRSGHPYEGGGGGGPTSPGEFDDRFRPVPSRGEEGREG